VIAALEPRDRILTNHRSAGHLLARGADPGRMIAEVLGRSDGYCKGKSGSLHISVQALGVVLTSTIVGGELSMVTGVALAQKLGYGEPGGITACFFGDGAACEGIFHESLNLAATWDLPVLYVCENNQWQALVHRREAMRIEHLSSWAQKFDMPAIVVDGNDVEAVNGAARDAVAQIRRTGRPYFLELQTYRQRGHYEPDEQAYVDADELAAWKQRDPIAAMSERLLKANELTSTELAALRQRAADEIDAAMLFAQASPWPAPAELVNDVYA
jgi:pyruvate dehydrogenase E1 component alpha subunit